MVTWLVKSPPAIPESTWVPNHVLASPLPNQLPAKGVGNAGGDDPSVWTPAPLWETQEKLLVPGFDLAHCYLMQLTEA